MRDRDLVVLCPDIAWEATLREVLARYKNLGLSRPVDAEVFRVPGQTDGGVRTKGVAILSNYRAKFHRALLILDWSGCGDDRPAETIQEELDQRLSHQWATHGRAIVVEPEIEAWIIGGHAQFGAVRNLAGVNAREWLAEHEFWPRGAKKPHQPKEAIEALFFAHNARKTSANYGIIAERASLEVDRCVCPSYRYFQQLLYTWFGPEASPMPRERAVKSRRR